MADTADIETAGPTRRTLLVLMAGLPAAVLAGCASDEPARDNSILQRRDRRRRMGFEGRG